MKTKSKKPTIPNFIKLQHEIDRKKLIEFPAFGILPFKVKDLSEDEMTQTLYELDPYPQHHRRMSQLFETELNFRKDE